MTYEVVYRPGRFNLSEDIAAFNAEYPWHALWDTGAVVGSGSVLSDASDGTYLHTTRVDGSGDYEPGVSRVTFRLDPVGPAPTGVAPIDVSFTARASSDITIYGTAGEFVIPLLPIGRPSATTLPHYPTPTDYSRAYGSSVVTANLGHVIENDSGVAFYVDATDPDFPYATAHYLYELEVRALFEGSLDIPLRQRNRGTIRQRNQAARQTSIRQRGFL